MNGKNDGRVERRIGLVEDPALRKSAGSKRPTIRGHAAVFDQLSSDLGGFRERIATGAFARAIRERHDVRALHNHYPDRVLGRTRKTLRLAGRFSLGAATSRPVIGGINFYIPPRAAAPSSPSSTTRHAFETWPPASRRLG